MRRPAFLASVATIAVVAAAPAFGQDAPTTPQQATLPSRSTAAAPVAGQTPDATDADTTQETV